MLVMPAPVMTTYLRPEQRVLFNPVRDANPVFHLMESIWMLAGRNDVDFLLPFNSKYSYYADDGVVHGAYGHRWRGFGGHDQILEIASLLKRDRGSRQAVMAMWDPGQEDLTGKWKDRPCNTHIYFDCRGGRLNMTVCCRSNDMIWGAYGANVVHFSILQEVIAVAVGIPMGEYRQFSNNFHVYTDVPMVKQFLDNPPFDRYDHYNTVIGAKPFPIMAPGENLPKFLEECEDFCDNTKTHFDNDFLTRVAQPLRAAYINRKSGKDDNWRNFLHEIPSNNDWKIAFNEWVARREEK